MNNNTDLTSEQIAKAVAAIRNIKPGYARMLDFYEKIFIAQADAGKHIDIKDFRISNEMLAVKRNDKFPLVDPSQFLIDIVSSEQLFKKICGIIVESGDEKTGSINYIIDAVDEKKLDMEDLFSAFLNDRSEEIERISGEFNTDSPTIYFIVYNSLQPSLNSFACRISSYLDKDNKWGKGYCPICGSPAVLSAFEKDGKRSLYCSFCWYKWPAERIYCPHCENTDHDTLHYFDFENEEEHRVDVCDKCRKYIKTVDARVLDRLMYPPLEHIATSHLDIRIKEMNFTDGIE